MITWQTWTTVYFIVGFCIQLSDSCIRGPGSQRNDQRGTFQRVTQRPTRAPQRPTNRDTRNNNNRVTDGGQDYKSCLDLTCDFTAGDFCKLNKAGFQSRGSGQAGWHVASDENNPANRLTGVVSKDALNFAVADLPDPRQHPLEPDVQFALETRDLTFTKPVYLAFQRYIAAEGLQLRVCLENKQSLGNLDCVWKSPPLARGKDNAKFNRQWKDELVRLKPGTYKVNFIGGYDSRKIFNAGQIGLRKIQLYSDSRKRTAIC